MGGRGNKGSSPKLDPLPSQTLTDMRAVHSKLTDAPLEVSKTSAALVSGYSSGVGTAHRSTASGRWFEMIAHSQVSRRPVAAP